MELPGVIAEIVEVAGTDAAWAIIEAKGGQQVFIPAEAREGHWLTELVGREAAEAICSRFSINGRGDDVLIPMASKARRGRAWSKAIADGRTVNQTAAALGVHRRTVFRHRRKKEKPDGQGDLF